MTPERLAKIMDSVFKEYEYVPLNNSVLDRMYDDIAKALIKVREREDFLAKIKVDLKKKVIVVGTESDLPYLGLLPYLVKGLRKDNELYLTYFLEDNIAILQCGIIFKDMLTLEGESCEIGFDIHAYEVTTLGEYHLDTNEFIREEDL